MAHGRWPRSWEEMAADVPAETIADPLGVGRLGYAIVPNGVRVYSVGPDLTDDRGVTRREAGERSGSPGAPEEGYAIVFRLLSPELRGATERRFREELLSADIPVADLEHGGLTEEKLKELGLTDEDLRLLGGYVGRFTKVAAEVVQFRFLQSLAADQLVPALADGVVPAVTRPPEKPLVRLACLAAEDVRQHIPSIVHAIRGQRRPRGGRGKQEESEQNKQARYNYSIGLRSNPSGCSQ